MRALRLGAPAAAAHRTWRVGLDASADFPTISEALAKARPGDTIHVGDGDYREALHLTEGVTLVGSRRSVLQPPLGAPSDWVAITVRQVTHGRIAGLRVTASSDQALGTGIVVEEATIELDDVEIVGTSAAGVDFRAGARGALRRSFVHDNAGPGVVVRAQAEPRVEFNVILHNGTRPGVPGPGVLVEAGAHPVLAANGIGANAGPAVAGWPAAGLAELIRQNVLSPTPLPQNPAPAPVRRPGRNRTP
jgi:hypothetical protein